MNGSRARFVRPYLRATSRTRSSGSERTCTHQDTGPGKESAVAAVRAARRSICPASGLRAEVNTPFTLSAGLPVTTMYVSFSAAS